jgi:hypothetical protein
MVRYLPVARFEGGEYGHLDQQPLGVFPQYEYGDVGKYHTLSCHSRFGLSANSQSITLHRLWRGLHLGTVYILLWQSCLSSWRSSRLRKD